MPLPVDLVLLDQHLPIIFRLHMAASGLALAAGFLTLCVRHWPHLHRPLGRFTAVTVVVGGLTALPSALWSEASAAARAGFFAQGCVWLSLLVVGLLAIRARDMERHRRAMAAMYAIATGAIWLRLATAVIAHFELPFEMSYAIVAWAGWSIPLCLVAWMGRPIVSLGANEQQAVKPLTSLGGTDIARGRL